jgi:hypothetical protein
MVPVFVVDALSALEYLMVAVKKGFPVPVIGQGGMKTKPMSSHLFRIDS